MLFEGLSKLMQEKEFSAITVTDLVEAAKVGRTTFYRNFDAIEDILHLRSDQVFAGLVDYLQVYRGQRSDYSTLEVLKPILRYFYLYSEIIELLIMANRDDIFQQSFRQHLEPFKSMYGEFYGVEEDYVEYMIALRIGAITNILTHWIKTGKKQAPDELADKLSAILSNERSLWVNI